MIKCEEPHIVNLTGKRCEGGTLQYQVLNSWGDGFTWIDAGSIAKNIGYISEIKK